MKANEQLTCECECGRKWDMDEDPTPPECEGAVWRLWADGEPGTWVSREGNPATPVGHEFPRQCNGICLTGADVGVPYSGIAYAHPDCDLHG